MLRAKAASVAAHTTARAFSTNVFANYSVFDGDIVVNIRPAFPRFSLRSYGWAMNRRVCTWPGNSIETQAQHAEYNCRAESRSNSPSAKPKEVVLIGTTVLFSSWTCLRLESLLWIKQTL